MECVCVSDLCVCVRESEPAINEESARKRRSERDGERQSKREQARESKQASVCSCEWVDEWVCVRVNVRVYEWARMSEWMWMCAYVFISARLLVFCVDVLENTVQHKRMWLVYSIELMNEEKYSTWKIMASRMMRSRSWRKGKHTRIHAYTQTCAHEKHHKYKHVHFDGRTGWLTELDSCSHFFHVLFLYACPYGLLLLFGCQTHFLLFARWLFMWCHLCINIFRLSLYFVICCCSCPFVFEHLLCVCGPYFFPFSLSCLTINR